MDLFDDLVELYVQKYQPSFPYLPGGLSTHRGDATPADPF